MSNGLYDELQESESYMNEEDEVAALRAQAAREAAEWLADWQARHPDETRRTPYEIAAEMLRGEDTPEPAQSSVHTFFVDKRVVCTVRREYDVTAPSYEEAKRMIIQAFLESKGSFWGVDHIHEVNAEDLEDHEIVTVSQNAGMATVKLMDTNENTILDNTEFTELEL